LASVYSSCLFKALLTFLWEINLDFKGDIRLLKDSLNFFFSHWPAKMNLPLTQMYTGGK